MAKPGPIAMWTQYLAARFGATALTCFDVNICQQVGASLGRGLYAADRRHRERAIINVRTAFPEWSDQRVKRVARASIEHFIALALGVCHTTRTMQIDTLHERIRLGRVHRTLEMLDARQPMIMLTGHFGNWEVQGFLLAMLGYELDAIARPIDNPLLNDWLLGIREARGLRIITKWDASQRMLDVLNHGGALAFIADQNAGDRGLFVPFFGKLGSTYKSIGLLAVSQNVPIVCAGCTHIGPGFRFEVNEYDIIYPEDWQDQSDPLFYVTARYIRAIESMVRHAPEQYLWMHRRWKSRPRFERQGKSMPASLQRKLESLPWMTQAEMDRLAEPLHPSQIRKSSGRKSAKTPLGV